MRLVLCLVLAVALSGCVNDPDVDPQTDARDPGDPVTVEDANTTTSGPDDAPAVRSESVPVDFAGETGTFAYGCEYGHTGQCGGQTVTEGASDLYVERPGTNVTAVSLTLTWDAASPATEKLVFEAMVMGLCDACDSTMLASETGTSPLTIDLAGLDAAMPDEHVFHAYVYSADGFVHHPPAFVHGSLAQSFSVAGNVTVQHEA